MKRLIALSSFAAVALALLSLRFLFPQEMQQQYFRAHNELERIAFGKDGTPALRKAVTAERMAEKNLFVSRSIGGKLVWLSIASSALAFALSGTVLAKQQSRRNSEEK